MSEIITDKLTGKTSAGDVTITSEGGSATMQLQQGLAKVWASINTDGSPFAVLDSLGTSSVSDNGGSNYTQNFTNSFDSINYAPSGFVKDGGDTFLKCVNAVDGDTHSTSALQLRTVALNASTYANSFDPDFLMMSFHGDLA